jgi:hypothetical protein
MTHDTQATQRRGMGARAVLESEVFRDACLEAEANIITAWRAAKVPLEREAAHAKLMALNEVVGVLKTLMKRGEYEADRAQQQAMRDASLPKQKGTE